MLATIIISAIIGAIFLSIVIKGIVNLKNGKHSCSCGGSCGSCGMNCAYRSNQNTDN